MSSNPWLMLGLSMAISMFIFSHLYRLALVWFVRGRVSPGWTRAAELMSILASLPLAAVVGLLWAEITLWLYILAAQNWPAVFPGDQVQVFALYRDWLAGFCALIYLAWTVPQAIAGSKVYAIDIQRNLNTPGS